MAEQMRFKLSVAPTVEPVTKAELKEHIRLTSGTLADNVTESICIFSGDHVTAASYSLVGTGISVLGYDALVVFTSGTNGAGGTVDVKLQDSDDDSTYTDVTSGAFTQVTTANDNAVYEKAYTGTKTYLRVVATVGTATCDFGVNILKYAIYSTEDDLLDTYIVSAREYVEQLCGPLITQTWIGYLNAFPAISELVIPKPRVQSPITSLEYYDDDSTKYTYSSDDYILDDISTYAKIILKSDSSWPTITLLEVNALKLTFVAGYGDAASDVPAPIKLAIKMLAAQWYENREPIAFAPSFGELPYAVQSLLSNYLDYGGGY